MPQSPQKIKKKKKKSKSPEIDINNDSTLKYYPIWMNKLSRCIKGLIKLHYEILDYVSSKLIPQKSSEDLLKQTSILLETEIKKISQYFDILPYGSYVQKLNTVNSDLDLRKRYRSHFGGEGPNPEMQVFKKEYKNRFKLMPNSKCKIGL